MEVEKKVKPYCMRKYLHDPPIPMQSTVVSFFPVAPIQVPSLTFSANLAI
jgi:hypothetical protein